MTYQYNKDEIKQSLTIEQVRDLVADLGGEPTQVQGNMFISATICHNLPGEGSHKLYYYDNGTEGIFHCYSGCGDSFDLFELVRRVFSLRGQGEYSLPAAVSYVARYFGIGPDISAQDESTLHEYLTYLKRYDIIKEKNEKEEQQKVELKEYDGSFLFNLPTVTILPWLKEGISRESMKRYEIGYEPSNHLIIIPHRDINGKLIGIRQRTMIKEDADRWGKYRPLYLNGKMFNSSLGFNLYGLYRNKENIKRMKKAIIFESEKSVLKYDSFFGSENNISVAVCGSSITQYQIDLLLSLGVEDIIIAFDRCGSEDKEEIKKYVNKFYNFQKKYGNIIHLDFIYDKNGEFLELKDSPIDKGKEVFIELFRRRINLYDKNY